ncbi:AraC family transcriptional regulator [Altererythrobacter sp. SALINAS58]|uniref:AraC family transcriptional regulator n=1 Tax=Alteripontixanthobacter muriae TaxID=2705546 RepID=UPI001576EFC1|nr:GyrI-like domain-containing protein [Alteripontixanthobacter muriae]NTZ42201.1 AraC family transcriptional regulator [Alteripontixanthobacter muriae]
MKPNQRSCYANRIERAITLMQQRLANGDAPTIDQLAAAAALSSYHFHRVFRVMTGETIGAALTRARLGGSLPMLDDSIMAATERAGYSTSQAHARALKERANVTPSLLKNDVDQRSKVAAELSRPAVERSETMPALEIAIESLMPLRLAVLRNIGDYNELNHGFNLLFERLMEHMSPDNISGLYGIPYDDPREVAAQNCRFDCAVTTLESATIGKGVHQTLIAGGLALRMSHVGDYDEIHPAIDDLYREAVLAELSIANEPLLIHFLDDPEEVPVDRLRAYVYLPLTPAASA